MPQETRDIDIDLLVVSRKDLPPAPDVVSKTIAAAGLGTANWLYPPLGESNTTPGKQKLGLYELRNGDIPATAEITVYQHEKAITSGMSESAFATLSRGLQPHDVRTLRDGGLAYNMRLSTPQPK